MAWSLLARRPRQQGVREGRGADVGGIARGIEGARRPPDSSMSLFGQIRLGSARVAQ